MKKMGLNEIRSKFLEFFASKGHYVADSYPLVPQNDKTLLLISAGMAPLKNYFMGKETPPNVRMATCQKCMRTTDVENVGHTARHATFFEMLGNFSFGDYFKQESIRWGWEFCIDWLELPEEKIWPSVYEEDDESYDFWVNEMKVPAERVVRLGKEDNFWEIGVGPCGPCSELYYDRGEKHGCGHADCKPGCECDRFVEFWNHVFTQFEKDEAGNYTELASKNIDTGMGLERIAMIMQDVDSIFEIDTMKSILDAASDKAGLTYPTGTKADISLRIITDHSRAITFMVGDGVLPNNEGRGYVLRRLLRRAARHGKLLGIEGAFLTSLVDEVIAVSGQAYPDIVERQDYIKRVINIEEDRFQQTIDQGLDILKTYIEEVQTAGGKELSGENAFKLYDTYGFPLDLTKEILEEKGLSVNEDAFSAAMDEQRERARSARTGDAAAAWDDDAISTIQGDIAGKFVGYDTLTASGEVIAIIQGGEVVEMANEGEAHLLMNTTSFYPEGGGQVGDVGVIKAKNFEFLVEDTKKGTRDSIIHVGRIVEGTVEAGMTVETLVNKEVRLDSARNHTATHLLHKALKMVLGKHAEQAGSLVEPSRLRFDFNHFQAMTAEEISKVEGIVNGMLYDPTAVGSAFMSQEEAKEAGAMALFGEKYGDTVRVVSVGDFSMELCGGTHLQNTSEIGMFKIISEGGVAAGVRRIEAITGRGVVDYLQNTERKLEGVAGALKAKVNDVENRAVQIQEELRALKKENESLKAKAASASTADMIGNVKKLGDFNLVATALKGVDANTMRTMGDQLKDKLDMGVVVLISDLGEKVLLLAMASDDAVKAGAHAGKLIGDLAKICGGGGGGRPNMAQAGGKDASKIVDAIAKAEEIVSAY